MNTHVTTLATAHSADDMALRELAIFANKNPAEFGGKMKGLLKVFGKSVESLARQFRENKVSPSDSATLNVWLCGKDKPGWGTVHMDSILEHLDMETGAFMKEFGLSMPACAVKSPAPAAVAPAPAPDPNLVPLLAVADNRPFAFGGYALRRMAEQQTNLTGLAKAFANAGLQPSDPRHLHAWLKGIKLENLTVAHLQVLLDYMRISAGEMLEAIGRSRPLAPVPTAPAPMAPADAMAKAEKEPQAEKGVIPSILAATANADRKAFGAMVMALRTYAGARVADLHKVLFQKGLVEKSEANTYLLLNGTAKWLPRDGKDRAAGVAAFFKLDEAQLLEAFHIYQKDPEGFDPGRFVKQGTPIETQRRRHMAEARQTRQAKLAAKASPATAPAPEPAREPPAGTVVEAIAEPEPQAPRSEKAEAPAATPPATGTRVAKVENRPAGIALQDMETPSGVFRPQEMAMLMLTQEQFAGMSEPERAQVLLQRVQQTAIRPELLSSVLFKLLSHHAAELEGPGRVKFLHTLMGDALAEG